MRSVASLRSWSRKPDGTGPTSTRSLALPTVVDPQCLKVTLRCDTIADNASHLVGATSRLDELDQRPPYRSWRQSD
jgi:hypothetical protein